MSRQFNIRLPELSHNQIAKIVDVHGLTKTQVIILAVDRLAHALEESSQTAQRDLKRPKTVARIVPQVELGQDE